MNNESCIQTIELLRRLALNIHGVIDVIDDRNCNDIINLLKEQEPAEPVMKKGRLFTAPTCRKCGYFFPTGTKPNYCQGCGQAVKWE